MVASLEALWIKQDKMTSEEITLTLEFQVKAWLLNQLLINTLPVPRSLLTLMLARIAPKP